MFGVGIGWFKGEFDYVSMNFTDRARRHNEYLHVLTALFSQDMPEFEGPTIRFNGLKFNPKPVQLPHPPFLIGGLTDAAMKRSVRYGDGFYGSAKSPEDAIDQVQRVRRFATEHGRTIPLEISFSAHWAPLTLDHVRRLGDAGVDRLLPKRIDGGGFVWGVAVFA
jgi:alkanesulfonate monooxygenase SsuD/methylene tetrahydromethanopterin reductase-like flavin-dependent oxidoreductase (luciferase family)